GARPMRRPGRRVTGERSTGEACCCISFFFQAEDGIRDRNVTGVQTCALPIFEEVYELIEAIDREDDDGIVEELGDVLLQVMLHSQIGEDNGYFTIDDVIAAITKKMIHRHPHVFGQTFVHTVEDVHQNWEALKQMEKGNKERQSVLDGVAKSLPSLAKAFHLQKKAAKVGFDWDDVGDIWKKLSEELSEVKEAIQHKQWTDVEEE